MRKLKHSYLLFTTLLLVLLLFIIASLIFAFYYCIPELRLGFFYETDVNELLLFLYNVIIPVLIFSIILILVIIFILIRYSFINKRKIIECEKNYRGIFEYLAVSNINYFESLAIYLSKSLAIDYVRIDKLNEDLQTSKALALYFENKLDNTKEYSLKNSPCGVVVEKMKYSCPSNVRVLFPNDAELQEISAESYVGITLVNSAGNPIGLISVIDRKPMDNIHLTEKILKITAVKAIAEIERWDAENTLHENETVFRYIYENSSDAIGIYNRGVHVLVNNAYNKLFGYSSETDLIGKPFANLIAPSERSAILMNIQRRANSEPTESDFETRGLKKEGTEFDMDLHLSSFIFNGEIYIMAIFRDITSRVMSVKNLTSSEARYRKLFETAKDGILIINADTGVIIDINLFLIEKLGYSYDVFIGKRIWDIKIFKDIVESQINFEKLMKNDYVWYDNILLETADGRKINVEFTSYLYYAHYQSVIQCNIRDISERLKFANELKETNAKLTELNASKDKFFKIITHDMKNPFISLLGASELLFENVYKYDINKIYKLTKLLNDSAKNGYNMLLDLLDWAKSQAGSYIFQPTTINLKELVNLNFPILFQFAKSKKVNLNIKIANSITVYADKDMLVTILRNLISNAIKFTHKNGIVTVNAKNKNNSVIISVQDTGIGIEKNDFDKLFRTDIKFNKPGTEHEGGTGLGLLLCKDFIEKHGGKLGIESEPNKGSTFYFNLARYENC